MKSSAAYSLMFHRHLQPGRGIQHTVAELPQHHLVHSNAGQVCISRDNTPDGAVLLDLLFNFFLVSLPLVSADGLPASVENLRELLGLGLGDDLGRETLILRQAASRPPLRALDAILYPGHHAQLSPFFPFDTLLQRVSVIPLGFWRASDVLPSMGGVGGPLWMDFLCFGRRRRSE